MSIESRLRRLEQHRDRTPPACPACGKRIYAVERVAAGRPAQCIHCQAVLPELPERVVVKTYIGIGFADL